MKRSATANWKGSGKEGGGTLSTDSKVLSNTQFSYKSRFEQGVGTNPDELIAAAHAGCFTMKLSFVIGAAGFTPTSIDTKCTVTLETSGITESHLEVKANVPGMDKAKFDEAVTDAKTNCTISKLLNTNITMDASLA
jgi:osmotically inducible protein OsmC